MDTIALYPYPSVAQDYRAMRRRTLNFETCGGEPAYAEPVVQRGSLTRLITRTTRRIVLRRAHRSQLMIIKEKEMSSTNDSRVRVETYQASGPVKVRLSTRSGDISVATGDTVRVELIADSARAAEVITQARVDFNPSSGELTVTTRANGLDGRGRRRWLEFAEPDLSVNLIVPAGSSLTVNTASGDTHLSGDYGTVVINSASGDVVARDSYQSLEVRTASGDVVSDTVRDLLDLKSASGDVSCAGVAQRTDIVSASGDVVVTADRGADVKIRAVSGDVIVRVAAGLVVDVDGRSMSGDVSSSIPLDGAASGGDSPTVNIKVQTVSGDVRLDRVS